MIYVSSSGAAWLSKGVLWAPESTGPEAGLLSRLVSEDPAASFPLDLDRLFGMSSPHLLGDFDSRPKKKRGEEQGGTR